jgi:hypothetical protein
VKVNKLDGLNEANVAAEFYHQCKVKGLQVVLEVIMPSAHHRSRQFKVDCMVVNDDGFPFCAVEFKQAGKEPGKGKAPPITWQPYKVKQVMRQRKKRPTRQEKAYDDLGLPWRYCIGKEDIRSTIEWTLNLIEPKH